MNQVKGSVRQVPRYGELERGESITSLFRFVARMLVTHDSSNDRFYSLEPRLFAFPVRQWCHCVCTANGLLVTCLYLHVQSPGEKIQRKTNICKGIRVAMMT